jgi:hypothetical protein
MGCAAREQAERMQWSQMAARYLEIYRELAAQTSAEARAGAK